MTENRTRLRRRRAARAVTEALAPTVLTGVYLLASPLLVPGATWLHGAIAVLFTTVLPFAAVLWFKSLGAVTDHHVSVRTQRRGPFVVAAVSLLVWGCLVALYVTLLVFLDINMWRLFLLGILGQAAVCLWFRLFRTVKEDSHE